MPHADFVHLRVHTAYSLAEGAIRLKALIQLCREQKMPAVAVTDTANLFGALEFATAAREAGIQPIVGCLFPVTREEVAGARQAIAPAPELLPLLVQSETGYRNLMRLISRAYLEGDPQLPAQLPLAEVAAGAEGLIAFTGGAEGPVGRLLAEGQAAAAEALLLRLKEAFRDRLYVELQRHGLPAEERIEEAQVELAYRHALPLVATNDCLFPRRTALWRRTTRCSASPAASPWPSRSGAG